MWLKHFRVQGFHSFEREQGLSFERDITLLAGRNNVGKTSLLHALRLPVDDKPGATAGRALEYIWELSADEVLPRLDLGVTSLLNPAIEQILNTGICEIRARLRAPQPDASFDPIPIPSGGVGRIVGAFEFERVEILDTIVALRSFRAANVSPSRGVLWWERRELQEQADAVQPPAANLGALVNALLASPFYFQPRRMTDRVGFAIVPSITADGSNLTTALLTRFLNERHDTFPQIEAFIHDVFPDIVNVEVPVDSSNMAEIFIAFNRRGGRLQVPLKYCGTGIEQLLMLSTAVLTTPRPTVFLIDEPHAFLHPYAERGLLRFLRQHPEHQYIVATHSPAFLNSYPLSHARLLTMDDEGSHITTVTNKLDILDQVGVTAVDLWSADAILWVEGPSEVAVLQQLLKAELQLENPLTVKAMPNAVRASAISPTKARQALEFYEAVSSAVLPVNLGVLFLFDSDERREKLRTEIEQATERRARFLPVRELENLFLSVGAIAQDLQNICREFELESPTLQQITADLDQLIHDTGNTALYPGANATPDTARVVGSEVLKGLYSRWARYQYDKVVDGPRLALLVRNHEPERLQPLMAVVRELTEHRA